MSVHVGATVPLRFVFTNAITGAVLDISTASSITAKIGRPDASTLTETPVFLTN